MVLLIRTIPVEENHGLPDNRFWFRSLPVYLNRILSAARFDDDIDSDDGWHRISSGGIRQRTPPANALCKSANVQTRTPISGIGKIILYGP
jgi:hypothetical protein